MSIELEGLSPLIVAALKSLPGTTREDLVREFPELDPDRADEDEFQRRYADARYAWHQRNSWEQMPEEVDREIVEQIRAEMGHQAKSATR
uniref:hypothetical protein n=1 Tax=Gordonia sp. B7-2 TaxID=3420932 RepID=UPI003D92329B